MSIFGAQLITDKPGKSVVHKAHDFGGEAFISHAAGRVIHTGWPPRQDKRRFRQVRSRHNLPPELPNLPRARAQVGQARAVFAGA